MLFRDKECKCVIRSLQDIEVIQCEIHVKMHPNLTECIRTEPNRNETNTPQVNLTYPNLILLYLTVT